MKIQEETFQARIRVLKCYPKAFNKLHIRLTNLTVSGLEDL